MYLFIFEFIGTQELILVGIIALIVFGPRKLPEMARKGAKFMRELKGVSNEFRATWEKEVGEDVNEIKNTIAQNKNELTSLIDGTATEPSTGVKTVETTENNILPEIREVSEKDYKKLVDKNKKVETKVSEKQDWL